MPALRSPGGCRRSVFEGPWRAYRRAEVSLQLVQGDRTAVARHSSFGAKAFREALTVTEQGCRETLIIPADRDGRKLTIPAFRLVTCLPFDGERLQGQVCHWPSMPLGEVLESFQMGSGDVEVLYSAGYALHGFAVAAIED